MKILILSTALSSHTIKWVRSISEENEVVLFSLPTPDYEINNGFLNLRIESLHIRGDVTMTEGLYGKFKYFEALPAVKRIIKNFKPDILHAHWATSYGLIGALSGFHPFILSVWGADVFDFPGKSFLHRKIVEFNLRKADRILSTSEIMAKETLRYTDKPITVTPFGIDTGIFRSRIVENIFERDSIVIGTIKTLEKKYGIDILINAFSVVRKNNPGLKLKLLIVGGGSEEESLRQLTRDLHIDADTVFTGKIKYDDVVSYYNMLDVYVAVSVLDSESFGVAVLEASACEKPVIVSDVGGLPEVVVNGETGIIVKVKNVEATSAAIERLIFDESLRKQFGINGRKRVLEKYDWSENVKQMISIYNEVLTKDKNNI